MDHVLLCILLNDLNAVCGGKTDMGEYSPLPSAPLCSDQYGEKEDTKWSKTYYYDQWLRLIFSH